MRQYTTPTLELTVKNQLLSAADVYVTLKHSGGVITRSGNEITVTETGGNSVIAVPFTQQETGAFENGETIAVQVNWMVGDNRMATEVAYVRVTENLLKEVLS